MENLQEIMLLAVILLSGVLIYGRGNAKARRYDEAKKLLKLCLRGEVKNDDIAFVEGIPSEFDEIGRFLLNEKTPLSKYINQFSRFENCKLNITITNIQDPKDCGIEMIVWIKPDEMPAYKMVDIMVYDTKYLIK